MKPIYFASFDEMYRWLEAEHDKRDEALVGYYKTTSGRPSVTWPESVDAALCFGWIDGVRRSVDAERYTIRFTPRRPRSNWSAKNVARMAELEALGLVRPAGRAAFAARPPERTGVYSYEQRDTAVFDEAQERRFRAHPTAWAWFQAQPPGYRKLAQYWVLSAKKAETVDKRLATLIEDSASGRPVAPLRRRSGAK